ncbi:MAG TPA: carbonic anhydrase [Planctomycetota bacterium]|nr:carbonic anhydrase [Planctomycetota bacterium]
MTSPDRPTPVVPAREAYVRLREGNRRFASDAMGHAALVDHERRRRLTGGQHPLAIVLGCSDSRVPAELVFDQGVGDLFVIRVAGNIIAPSLVGSVEFAAERFGTRLVVVLGHSGCGAIEATFEELESGGPRYPNLKAIVDRIRPAVAPLLELGVDVPRERLLARAVRANIRASAGHLRHGSAILEELIEREGLVVVGAEYSLETGVVDFFDGAPPGP